MISPLRDRIIVRQDAIRADVSAAGILIAASKGIVTSQEQLGRTGTVVACGEKVDQDQLKPGDRICYGEFDYQQVDHQGEKLIVMQDADVVGVIEA